MKDKLNRDIQTGDVIAYGSSARGGGLDFYYVISTNEGSVKAFQVNPYNIETIPEVGCARMFTMTRYDEVTRRLVYEPMDRKMRDKQLTKGSRLSLSSHAYIMDDEYANIVKRFVNDNR